MAEVPVVLKVVAGGAVSQLRRVNQQAKNLSKRFKETARSAAGITKKLNGLSGVLGRLALAEAGRRAVAAAADYAALQQRIALLTSDYGENAAALEVAAKAAKTFGLSQREAAGGVADIYARLRPMGVSLEDIETTFVGFNTAAKLSGASAVEAAGAFRQLSQALGSGRLQGDEFRSISEQMPAIMTAISREMGQPVGKLKKLASEGQITADIVIASLERIEREGAGKIASIMENSPVQKMKDLQNEIEKLQIAVGENLIPVALPLTKLLTTLLIEFNKFNPAVKGGAIAALSLAAGIVVVIPSIVALKAALAGIGIALAPLLLFAAKWALIAGGVAAIGIGISQIGKEARDARKEFEALLGTGSSTDLIKKQEELTKQLDKLVQTPVSGTGRAKAAAGKEKQRQIKVLQDRIKTLETEIHNKEMSEKDEAKEAFLASKTPEKIAEAAKARAASEKAALAPIVEQTALLEAQLAGKEQEFLLEQEVQKLLEKGGLENEEAVRAAIEKREQLKGQVEEAEKLKGIFKELGTEIKDSMVEGLKAAIKGTESLGEAVGNILNRISDKLLDIGLNFALSKLPFMAKGGPVSRGSSYIVGEKGPEVFTPSRSGAIVPNDQLGGGSTSVVVNVDASGSAVEGEEEQGRELGNMLASVVQAEIVRQKRPGGLLAT